MKNYLDWNLIQTFKFCISVALLLKASVGAVELKLADEPFPVLFAHNWLALPLGEATRLFEAPYSPPSYSAAWAVTSSSFLFFICSAAN